MRIQIDDLQRSKDNLERSAFTLLDEIKNLKSKVDLEALALNSINGDLSNKTRRLEDENRLQVSFKYNLKSITFFALIILEYFLNYNF